MWIFLNACQMILSITDQSRPHESLWCSLCAQRDWITRKKPLRDHWPKTIQNFRHHPRERVGMNGPWKAYYVSISDKGRSTCPEF